MNRDDRDFLAVSIMASGLELAHAQPGDIVAAHSKGIIGRLIRLFTRSEWNHIAIIETVGATEAETTVIQAEAHGVLRASLDQVAPGGYYSIIACPKGVNRKKVVAEARSLLRTKYAFVSIVSVLFNLIPFPVRLDVRERSTLICSAVGAISLLTGGWIRPWPDLYQVTPAELAEALISAGT